MGKIQVLVVDDEPRYLKLVRYNLEAAGYEVCTRIREFSSVPIIMLTARGEGEEKVRGLRLGADDYVTKPFAAEELMARVETVLRRSHILEAQTPSSLNVGELTIDFVQRKVTIGGQEVSLSPTEYRLLQCLAVNAGRVIVQEVLQEKVWGPEYREHYEGLRVFIRRLRQKIEKNPNDPAYILTKPGVGYMFRLPS